MFLQQLDAKETLIGCAKFTFAVLFTYLCRITFKLLPNLDFKAFSWFSCSYNSFTTNEKRKKEMIWESFNFVDGKLSKKR